MKPISIKHIDHIIERVYERYPIISRYEVSRIVFSFFDTMRNVLIAGDSLSISDFVSKIKLISFVRNHYRVVKTQVKTPKKIKNA